MSLPGKPRSILSPERHASQATAMPQSGSTSLSLRGDQASTTDPLRGPRSKSLADSFFPAVPCPEPLLAWKGSGPLLCLLSWLLGVAASLFRQTGVRATSSIWAEDGTIFLQQALRRPFESLVLTPYNGYMHLVPRLITGLAVAVPLSWASAVYALAAAALASFVAFGTYVLSSAHIRSRLLRLGLAGAVIALPQAVLEVANVTANAHWYLLYGAFWALLCRPRSIRHHLIAVCLVVLGVGSDPLTILLLPLVLLRAVTLRHLRDQIISTAFVVAAILQIWVVHAGTRVSNGTSPTMLQLFRSYAARVVANVLYGVIRATSEFDVRGYSSVLFATTAVSLLLLCAFVLGNWGQRIFAGCAALWSLLLFAVPVGYSWFPGFDPSASDRLNLYGSGRYNVVPELLLLTAIVVGLDCLAGRLAGRWQSVVPVLAILAGSWLWHGDYRLPNARSGGPDWSASIEKAGQQCDKLSLESTLPIVIAPTGWRVSMPCRLIRA
jgi:hypothetical protein